MNHGSQDIPPKRSTLHEEIKGCSARVKALRAALNIEEDKRDKQIIECTKLCDLIWQYSMQYSYGMDRLDGIRKQHNADLIRISNAKDQCQIELSNTDDLEERLKIKSKLGALEEEGKGVELKLRGVAEAEVSIMKLKESELNAHEQYKGGVLEVRSLKENIKHIKKDLQREICFIDRLSMKVNKETMRLRQPPKRSKKSNWVRRIWRQLRPFRSSA
mmetsp:Transcript_17971/g.37685  ORF Transcript_17971/g.37685 Transcript_17971/m.37685 type:complete len:217 (-) Transcript_17971:98-748(-)|eukprot:CAMPEP_0171379236 /NCGR_PEP_ID=MMETSP0879-20121228/25968_1 /TAXON_ID=67004 /ORGANISM="Thalassiosira weissflogii, Strain CCMP1336" /LENGTH=216 /DNA_ID=CAMNT_0011889925 /DNA_START=243 /DNA_END=893 /DNA_ORIENTATION=-